MGLEVSGREAADASSGTIAARDIAANITAFSMVILYIGGILESLEHALCRLGYRFWHSSSGDKNWPRPSSRPSSKEQDGRVATVLLFTASLYLDLNGGAELVGRVGYNRQIAA
jgi:hypothetical protein